MKKTLLTIFAVMTALMCAASCSDNLQHGSVDLTPGNQGNGGNTENGGGGNNNGTGGQVDQTFQYPTSYNFSHPCALVSAEDINRAKAAVAAASAADPVYVSWQNFCKNSFTQAGYRPTPVETIVRGDPKGTGVDSENYGNIMRDASAAYQLALRWKISGDNTCADAAVLILNAWAAKCKKITANDNNQYLCAGFQGYTLGNAAELLRDYKGWTESDQNVFKTWLRTVWVAKN